MQATVGTSKNLQSHNKEHPHRLYYSLVWTLPRLRMQSPSEYCTARIVGSSLPNLQDIYISCYICKATSFVKDPHHAYHGLSTPAPIRQRFLHIRIRSAKLCNSFFPQAVLNTVLPPSTLNCLLHTLLLLPHRADYTLHTIQTSSHPCSKHNSHPCHQFAKELFTYYLFIPTSR